MKNHLFMLAVASSCMAILPAGAQMAPASPTTASQANEEYRAAREQIAATYKSDKAACDAMKDNAKDVCIKEAKGKEDIAKAELDQKMKPSESNSRKVAEAKVEAKYDVAKEKCDDQKGEAKSACVKEAKAAEAKGKADIRASMTPKK